MRIVDPKKGAPLKIGDAFRKQATGEIRVWRGHAWQSPTGDEGEEFRKLELATLEASKSTNDPNAGKGSETEQSGDNKPADDTGHDANGSPVPNDSGLSGNENNGAKRHLDEKDLAKIESGRKPKGSGK